MNEPLRLLRFDSIGGASGDMILSALIGLGISIKEIEGYFESLQIGKIILQTKKVVDHGIVGTQLTINAEDNHGHHRYLKDINKILNASKLPESVITMSISIFQKLADAEAIVHGTTPEEIHFHEVGAVDSIADIAGVCLALYKLNINAVNISPLPSGTGIIECEHGIMPNPAPATIELLKGMETFQTGEPNEMVTPTAAAILSFLKDKFPVPTLSIPFKILSYSWGVGHKKLVTRPNVIRVTLMEANIPSLHDQCLVLETNIDDMSPQLIGALTNRLLENGALDVYTTPIFMKKQRHGVLLTVICHHCKKDDIMHLIFTESTTFGIREYSVNRTMLERKIIPVVTRFGTIRIKIGLWQNKIITKSPEYEDCLTASLANNVPLKNVMNEALSMLDKSDHI